MRNSIRLLGRVPKPRPAPPVYSRPTLQPPLRTIEKANEDVYTDETKKVIRKRRPFVYAVGFAVITVAGAILGAQLKSTKQEHERRKEIETAAQELATTSSIDAENQQPDIDRKESPDLSTTSHGRKGGNPYAIDVARQIALLENRKSLLKRQKQTLEAKIEKIHERRIRKDQMDARRVK